MSTTTRIRTQPRAVVRRTAAAALVVALAVIGATAPASALSRPNGPGQSAPETGGAIESPGEETSAPGGGPTRPRPPGNRGENVEDTPSENAGDTPQSPSTPLDVSLQVTVDRDEATATMVLVEPQFILDPDEIADFPSPVSVDLLWGDGARASFPVDGEHFGPEVVTHRYRVDETTDFTVFAYVTDDRGGVGVSSQRIQVHALYDVTMDRVTFRPYHHDCDGFWTGDGDFEVDYHFEWDGQSQSDHWEFDLDDGESRNIVTGGLLAEAVTVDDHPSLHITWFEDDPGLNVPPPPSAAFDIPLTPDPDLGSTSGFEVRRSGDCQVRVDYRLTTRPHR